MAWHNFLPYAPSGNFIGIRFNVSAIGIVDLLYTPRLHWVLREVTFAGNRNKESFKPTDL